MTARICVTDILKPLGEGRKGGVQQSEEVEGVAKWLTLRKSVFVNNVVYWDLLTPEGKDTVASKHQDPLTNQCSVIS
jgi:hypothetical protein